MLGPLRTVLGLGLLLACLQVVQAVKFELVAERFPKPSGSLELVNVVQRCTDCRMVRQQSLWCTMELTERVLT